MFPCLKGWEKTAKCSIARGTPPERGPQGADGTEDEDEQMTQPNVTRTLRLTVLAGSSALLLAACDRPLDMDLRGGFGDGFTTAHAAPDRWTNASHRTTAG